MAETEDQLRRMVMTFRVSELQMLLGYAGKNKTGRKNELQSRAIELVRLRNPSIQQKIKELYKSIQLEMMSFGDRSGQGAPVAGAPGLHPSQKVPMGLGSIAGYPQASVGAIATANSASRYAASSAQVSAGMAQGGVAYSGLTSHGQSSYPINPDVKLKRLPFYDILGELLKPSSLAPQGSGRYQEAGFSFSLTPQQANKIANSRDLRPGKQDYTVQVQMRFCLLETSCEQEDNFPPNIAVKINEKMCPLPSPIPTNKPGVEPKRPSRPVNVTALCRISPTVTNRVNVSWASEYGRCYVISVYLVQKLSSDDLLSRLKNKGARIADFTRSLIKQKLQEDADCEIATTSLRCSLQCPLGKMRMMLPARSTTCDHLQCFDASLFLQMNERKPTWTCPVCDKTATYDNLVIDGYFQEVLQKASNCSEVSLDKSGDWTPLIPKKEPKEEVVKRKPEVQCETLDSDSDDNGNDDGDASIVEEAAPKKSAPVVVDCITLSDSEDEDGPPPAKRPNNGQGMSSASIAAANTPAPTPTAEGDNTTTGGSSTPGGGGGGGAVTPPGSVSPQIICLDSPTSSPSPPRRPDARGLSPLPQGITVTPCPPPTSASPTTDPNPTTSSTPPAIAATITPPVSSNSSSSSTISNSSSSDTTTTATTTTRIINVTSRSSPPLPGTGSNRNSPVPDAASAATITPVITPPLSSSQSELTSNTASVSITPTTSGGSSSSSSYPPATTTQDAAGASYSGSTSSAAVAAASAAVAAFQPSNTYPLPAALQSLFSPLTNIMPPTTLSSTTMPSYMPPDRYM